MKLVGTALILVLLWKCAEGQKLGGSAVRRQQKSVTAVGRNGPKGGRRTKRRNGRKLKGYYYGDYAVSATGIGRLNLNQNVPAEADPQPLFIESSGTIECESWRGCVIGNSGVFAVDVERDVNGNLLPLNLLLYPTREDYSINIMCEDFADRIVANSCKATANPQPAVRLDAGGFGCTIVGTGENTDEVQIEALCQSVAGLVPPTRSSKSSKL